MSKAITILLFSVLWTGSTRSIAIHFSLENLHASETPRHLGAIHQTRSFSIVLLFETQESKSSPTGPLEEESEDEDNTSKENVFGKMNSFYYSQFLQQLYDRQNALFKEHHVEIESPPPQRVNRGI